MITYSPSDIFVAAGSEATVEHISTTNDTSSTVVATCSIRTRGFYAASVDTSWLIGGSEDPDGVESFDHSTNIVTTLPDAPSGQIGGCSLFGNIGCYLVGDSASAAVNVFDTSNATFSSTSDLPVRVTHPNGRADDAFGWVVGGVKPDGYLYSTTQKIDISNDTWTITSISYTGGVAKQGSFYSGLLLYSVSGVDQDGLSIDIQQADVTTDTYTFIRLASATMARTNAGSINNYWYGWLIGGYNLGNSDIVERYDFSTDTTDAVYRTSLTNGRVYPLCVGDLTVKTYTGYDDDRGSVCVSHMLINGDRSASLPYSLGSGPIDNSPTKYIAGGQNFDQIYNSILKFNTTVISLTALTATVNPRYSCAGVSNPDFSWFVAGYDSTGTALSTVDKFDHSTESVTTGPALPIDMAPVVGSSLSDIGIAVTGGNAYQLDFATDTWTSFAYSNTDIFQGGAGTSDSAILLGGEDTGTPTADVDVYDKITSSWIYAKYSLSEAKFGLTAQSITDKTIITGGTIRAQIATIEHVNHLAEYSTVTYRGQLSETKSRGGSAVDSLYMWLLGGYRSSALDTIERLDPFTDTGDAVSVSLTLPEPRHSGAYTSVVDIAERNDYKLTIVVPTANTHDLYCSIVLLGSGDVSNFSPVPYGTHTNDVLIDAPRIPLAYDHDLLATSIGADPYNSDRVVQTVVGDKTGRLCVTEAKDVTFDKSAISTSYVLSTTTSFIDNDRTWFGGGYQINKYEKLDITHTLSIVGDTFYPRMGGAAGSSSEFAWIGGGSTTDNIVEYFIFDNDTITTGDRSNLSSARSYLSAASDSSYVWYFCGIDSNGVVGTVDRLDKLNDVVAAQFRVNDWPRSQLTSDFIHTNIYAIGGQVGSYYKNFISALDPSNDTVIVHDTPLPTVMAGHSSAEQVGELFIFFKKNYYRFNPTTDLLDIIGELSVYHRQSAASTLGHTIIISGGTGYDDQAGDLGSIDQLALFDPTTYGYEMMPVSMTYKRYNHWSFSESNQTTNASESLRCSFAANGEYGDQRTINLPTTSSEYSLPSIIHLTGGREIHDLLCGLVTQSGCVYGPHFEQAYIINTQNILWKFDFTCRVPSNLGQPASAGARQASISTGYLGYYIGGSAHDTTIINYSTDTTRIEGSLVTDDVSESSSIMILSDTDKCLMLGGTNYNESWNNRLAITDKIRNIDLSNYTIGYSTIVLPKETTRSSYVNGYIFGGSTTADHLLDDQIIAIDIATDVPTVSATVLPMPDDLSNAIVDVQSNIVISSGVTFDPSTETIVSPRVWPAFFGEAFFRGRSVALYWGGYSERGESDIKGKVYASGTYNNTAYIYDQNTTVLSACSLVQPVASFNLQGNCAYEYCIPEVEGIDFKYSITTGQARIPSDIDTIVVRDYTYADRLSLVPDSYDEVSSDVVCTYTAFGSELRLSLAVSANNIETDRKLTIPIAVEHYDSDRASELPAVNTVVTDRNMSFAVEQLRSDRSTLAIFPSFYTYLSTIVGTLTVGGSITSRRATIPAAHSVAWSLSRDVGILPILINKDIATGSFIEIINKLVKGDDSLYDIDLVLGEIEKQFGDADFIFSLEENKGVAADQSVLIKTGQNIQVVHLLMRLTGTRMWVSNAEGGEFVIDCGQKYPIYGIGEVPIIGRIMYLKLILPEVLSSGHLTFEFKSPHSSCLLKLLSM